MKCFSCNGSGHSAKECQKPKNECPDCWFLEGLHKKECRYNISPGTAMCTTNSTLFATSWDNNQEPFYVIQGMDYEQMKAYFFDLKDTYDQWKTTNLGGKVWDASIFLFQRGAIWEYQSESVCFNRPCPKWESSWIQLNSVWLECSQKGISWLQMSRDEEKK